MSLDLLAEKQGEIDSLESRLRASEQISRSLRKDRKALAIGTRNSSEKLFRWASKIRDPGFETGPLVELAAELQEQLRTMGDPDREPDQD